MSLPLELLCVIADYLPINALIRAARTCRNNARILSDNHFWRKRYERDFVFIDFKLVNETDWRKIYKHEFLSKTIIRYCYYHNDVLNLQKAAAMITPQSIELEKVPIVIHRINQILRVNSNTKFIIVCTYRKTIRLLQKLLPNHMKHEHLIGVDECFSLVKIFDEANLSIHTLLCSHYPLSYGVTLIDTNGNYPRHMFILEELNEADTMQVAARVMRMGNKSQARVEVIENNRLYDKFNKKPYDINIYFVTEIN